MIKVVSFDVWDTLLRVSPVFDAICNRISLIAGVSVNDVNRALSSVKKLARELKSKDELDASRAVSFCQEKWAEELGVKIEVVKKAVAKAVFDILAMKISCDNAIYVLKEVKSKGYSTVCIGNVNFWPSAYTRIFLEKEGLSEYIDAQFYSDEVGFFKPSKEIFSKALAEFDVSPDEVIHIGDKEVEDYNGALSAGMKAFLIKSETDLLNVLKIL